MMAATAALKRLPVREAVCLVTALESFTVVNVDPAQ